MKYSEQFNQRANETKLKNLIDDCKLRGYKVEFVGKNKLYDYGGMNPKAAQSMGIKGYPKNTIWIRRDATAKYKYETLLHELEEMNDMKTGTSYWDAHTTLMDKELVEK